MHTFREVVRSIYHQRKYVHRKTQRLARLILAADQIILSSFSQSNQVKFQVQIHGTMHGGSCAAELKTQLPQTQSGEHVFEVNRRPYPHLAKPKERYSDPESELDDKERDMHFLILYIPNCTKHCSCIFYSAETRISSGRTVRPERSTWDPTGLQ